MSGHVQIASDKSAQFNPKQDQTLLNRGFLHPFPMRTKCLSAPATLLVSVERDSKPGYASSGCFLVREGGWLRSQASLVFSASLKWVVMR